MVRTRFVVCGEFGVVGCHARQEFGSKGVCGIRLVRCVAENMAIERTESTVA